MESTEDRRRGGSFPWYRSHARAALLVACGLFAVVTVARLFTDGAGEAVDILYSLPVALLAMAFGIRGGLIGALIGFTLFAVVEVANGAGDIDATGWVARAAGLLLLGVLLGLSTDQIETGQRRGLAAQAERQSLQEGVRRQVEALEISDSILQNLAVAKWMIEGGRDDEAIEILTATMVAGGRVVADLLPVRRTVAQPLSSSSHKSTLFPDS